MPKKTQKQNDEIKEKLEYLGLDLNKIPQSLKKFEPLKFKPTTVYEESKHKQYRFIDVKEIEIILSPTNRLDELKDKYSKASPIYSYLIPDKKENIIRHTTFLNMLKNIRIEDIEKVEEEQKALSKNIPFKVKYPGNYLWQIYYSENTNKYFMIVPTDDSDYSAFFYLLKKKLEKRRITKVFVPISHVDYSNNYFKKSQFEDLENYLWAFTKDWPKIYEVYTKKEELNIHIVGETNVFENVKSAYKIVLSSKEEAEEFYKLLKALFMLQTEVPHYYNFETNIDRHGRIVFLYDNKKIEYKNLTDFIKSQYLETEQMHNSADGDIKELEEKLENLRVIASSLEIEYLAKEKQISTFLECKKSFFGKMKYFFKYSKKSKGSGIKDLLQENDIDEEEFEKKFENRQINEDDEEIIVRKRVKEKENYTIEELIDVANEYYIKETQMRNLLMDINAIKLRNKNMEKKIENASAYIAEIDSHKKSIFEFWKYSNKDEIANLPEGEMEEINVKKKISKVFDYKEDLEEFGIAMDSIQRKALTKEELDSVFIASTNVLDILNKVKTNTVMPKDMENALKAIKQEAKEEERLIESGEFDIFAGKLDDSTKIKMIANKKHRELPKDKYSILELTKNSKQLGYKLSLERVINNINTAVKKIRITEAIPVYKASTEENLNENMVNIFDMNPEKELMQALDNNNSDIYLFKYNLTRNENAILFTNIIFYDNKNKTLPLGMNLSSSVLFEIPIDKVTEINNKTFRIVKIEDDGESIIKNVTMIEYNVENDYE